LKKLTININEAGYGKKTVLRSIEFEIEQGEIVALIGPNGAGKSTLLKAMMGLVPRVEGTVRYNDVPLPKQPEQVVRLGISFVPQGNRVLDELTVSENLEVGGYLLSTKTELDARIAFLLEHFPDLQPSLQKPAASLSGGQKQMLALARALVLEPKVLLLDEPSHGLAPKVVADMFNTLQRINEELGVTLLVVEQKVREVLTVADMVYALRSGEIVFSGSPDELRAGDHLEKVFLV